MITSERAQQLDKAIVTATVDFMHVVTGKNPDAKRSAGIPATTQDIRTIRKFVSHAYGLPRTLNAVEHELGYDKSHIKGLGPLDLHTLYNKIRTSVDYWPDIEEKMKEVGTGLIVTSGDLQVYGSAIIDLVKSIEGYADAELTLGDVTGLDLSSLPDIPLSSSGTRKLPALLDLVQGIVELIEVQHEKSQRMKELFNGLKGEFRALEYDVQGKLKLCTPTQPDGTLNDLAAQIANINTRTDEELRVYETFTKYTWIGAWWGPLGLAISYSIYSGDAESARERLAGLRAEKDRLVSDQAVTSAVMRSMTTLQTNMQNLQLRLEDATASTAHLESLWSVILEYINSSHSQLKKNNSATLLHSLVTRLTVMINNWVAIKPEAQKLFDALDDAIRD